MKAQLHRVCSITCILYITRNDTLVHTDVERRSLLLVYSRSKFRKYDLAMSLSEWVPFRLDAGTVSHECNRRKDQMHVLYDLFSFNYYTDSRVLQANMETSPLEKKTGTNYGPPGKSALVFFLDDLNLPEVRRYP